MIGQGTVVRVESQRTLGGVPLVKDGDGFFPRGELGVVDLAQVEDVTLDRAAGCAATFHDAPVSVDLPVLLASMAAQEHRPTPHPEIRESRHGGRSALHGKSLLGAEQSIGFPRKTDGRKGEIAENRCPVAKVRLVARIEFRKKQEKKLDYPQCLVRKKTNSPCEKVLNHGS